MLLALAGSLNFDWHSNAERTWHCFREGGMPSFSLINDWRVFCVVKHCPLVPVHIRESLSPGKLPLNTNTYPLQWPSYAAFISISHLLIQRAVNEGRREDQSDSPESHHPPALPKPACPFLSQSNRLPCVSGLICTEKQI
jgi:hypothetical protein